MPLLHTGQPEAEAESGTVSCPGNLALAVELAIQYFCSLVGFLAPIHLTSLLPIWAQPKAFSNLGNGIHDDISRESLVVVHSEGEEARTLEAFG